MRWRSLWIAIGCCLLAPSAEAAVVMLTHVQRDGRIVIEIREQRPVAENCPADVQRLLDRIQEIMERGEFSRLGEVYAENARFVNDQSMLGGPLERRERDLASLEKVMIQSRQYMSHYGYARIEGACRQVRREIVYDGTIVEAFIVGGRMLYGHGEIRLRFDPSLGKVVEYRSVTKISGGKALSSPAKPAPAGPPRRR